MADAPLNLVLRQLRRLATDPDRDCSDADLLERFARQRDEGWFPEGSRSFNLTPDIANALAWYAPDEKGFIDHRFELFGGITREYLDLRLALFGAPRTGAEQDWQSFLVSRKVERIIVYSTEPELLRESLAVLWNLPADREEKDWAMLYLDGRTKDRMGKISAAGFNARGAYDEFLNGLKDQIKFLGHDLTPGGVAALKGDAAKLNAKAKTMFEKMDGTVATATTSLDALRQP